MRIAVADVGTNSCHLLIAESRAGGYRILDALKDRTRLGECLQDGQITEEGYARLERALRRFRELAASAAVPTLRVYATSAMREARNGAQIAARLRDSTGVYPQIISGEREGQLTYLGAAQSVTFGSDNLLLDLGGGSLELVRGNERQALSVVSLPLGSVRMRLRFLPKDPPGSAALRQLTDAVRDALAPHLDAFGWRDGTRVTGSSGTFETLGAMLAASDPHGARGVNGYTFDVAELAELLEKLRKLDAAKRAKVPGMDPRRADIILAGLAVVHAALSELGVPRVTVSEGALREGMLVEFLAEEAAWEAGLSAAQRSVLEVAQRFHSDLAHARHVADLAGKLLTRLRAGGEDFAPDAAELLNAGAMLHEIGTIVSQGSHHKHGWYLARHAGLRGFDPRQLDVVALLVRYHRKSPPRDSHAEFAQLTAEQQRLVWRLGSILRVADGLDRSHTQGTVIEQLRRAKGWELRVRGASELDVLGARDKSDMWAEVFGPLSIESPGSGT